MTAKQVHKEALGRLVYWALLVQQVYKVPRANQVLTVSTATPGQQGQPALAACPVFLARRGQLAKRVPKGRPAFAARRGLLAPPGQQARLVYVAPPARQVHKAKAVLLVQLD